MRYFEDLTVGEQVDLGSLSVSTQEIVDFARRYDPQPMHLDPVAAEKSALKGLAGSGWQSCTLANRRFVEGFTAGTAYQGLAGVEECRWIKPFYPAERAGPLTMRLEVEALSPSESRPEYGLARVKLETLQRDPAAGPDAAPRLICLQRFRTMIARRTPAELSEPRIERAPAESRARAPARSAEAALAYANTREALACGPALLGAAAFSAEEIKAFAREFDPLSFHLEEAAARNSLFGGLTASGWHVMCRYMRLVIEARTAAIAALPPEKQAAAAAGMGPSPGYRNLRWLRPIRPGDVLRYISTPTRVRAKEHWKDWAVLHATLEAENQNGELVMRFDSEAMMRL